MAPRTWTSRRRSPTTRRSSADRAQERPGDHRAAAWRPRRKARRARRSRACSASSRAPSVRSPIRSTSRSRSSGENGLVRKRSAPASPARRSARSSVGGGEHDDRRVRGRRARAQRGAGGDAVEARHVDVEEDDRRLARSARARSPRGRRGLDEVEARDVLERRGDQAADERDRRRRRRIVRLTRCAPAMRLEALVGERRRRPRPRRGRTACPPPRAMIVARRLAKSDAGR